MNNYAPYFVNNSSKKLTLIGFTYNQNIDLCPGCVILPPNWAPCFPTNISNQYMNNQTIINTFIKQNNQSSLVIEFYDSVSDIPTTSNIDQWAHVAVSFTDKRAFLAWTNGLFSEVLYTDWVIGPTSPDYANCKECVCTPSTSANWKLIIIIFIIFLVISLIYHGFPWTELLRRANNR